MSKGEGVTNVDYVYENEIKILKGLPLIEISKLKKNPKNIKTHPKEQIHDIAELMKMVGFKDPIAIDKNNLIWAGHGKLKSAELLGMKRVPYIFLENMTEKQKKLFMIMDNKVNESRWVSENLKIVMDELPDTAFDNFDMSFDETFSNNLQVTDEEWKGMPEFDQPGEESYRRIIIKFEDEKGIKKFIKLTGLNITDITKGAWFPYRPQTKTTKEYVDA